MSNSPQEEPFSESNLESPEYRERLMRKLNCLIAVLEVATTKVKASMANPQADLERLGRVRANLQSTLAVCMQARSALERREALPRGLQDELAQAVREEAAEPAAQPRRNRPRASAPLETASEAERAKFEVLPPIETKDLAAVDLESLMRQLLG